MPTEEERQAAEDARLRALAGGASDEPGAEPDDEMSSSTVPEDDEEAPPSDEEIRAANEAGAGDEPEPEPETEAGAGSEASPPRVPGSDTFRGRISQLSADKRTLRQQLADRDAEIERLRAGSAASADPPVQSEPGAPQRRQFATQADFDAAVAAEATRRAATTAFNSRCNDVEVKGATAFGRDWVEAKNALALLDDDGIIPMDLLTPALETEHPHRVILALGQDPDLAGRLLAMNPVKRAMEIARMDAAFAAPPPPRRSSAPPPVDPIRGRPPVGSSSTRPSDRDDDATWLRKRNAELAAKAAARG